MTRKIEGVPVYRCESYCCWLTADACQDRRDFVKEMEQNPRKRQSTIGVLSTKQTIREMQACVECKGVK